MTQFPSVQATAWKHSKPTCMILGVTCACAVFLASSASNAQAGLAEFEAIQAAHPSLLNQWKFEGSDDSTRLADSSSAANHLVRTTGREGGDPNNIVFGPGFDGISQSYQPEHLGRIAGAGLFSSGTTALPASLTAEAVFQLDAWEGEEVGYLISARPSDRAYMLVQTGSNGTSFVTSTFGDTFTDRPVVLEYTPGDWYYMAVVASFDTNTGITSVNWYGANLTQGDVTMSLLASDNTTFTGNWTGSDAIGVGNFRNGGQNYLQGRLDNVGLTGALLTQEELQWRLDALLIDVSVPATIRLIARVNESDLRHKRPLIASLEAALASINRGSRTTAVNQLHAFRKTVRVQVPDPVLAMELIEGSCQIIKVLGGDDCGCIPAGGVPGVEVLVLEYRFNETGMTAFSTGSNSTSLTLSDVAGVPTDLHSQDMRGVSGTLGDRCFDNSTATGMGAAGIGGGAHHPSDLRAIDVFSSFTLQGWYHASIIMDGYARLFENGSTTAGWNLMAWEGKIALGMDGVWRDSGPNVYNQTGQWIFFAVTYDGTRTSNNLKFYRGTKTETVSQVGATSSMDIGSVDDSGVVFGIGNTSVGNGRIRPFDGYLDNMRVFGADSGSSGVLDLTQLEAIRQHDLQLSPTAAIERLIALVNESSHSPKRPLMASLEAALASVERGNHNSATGQLGAFQNKVSAQVYKKDAALAMELIDGAGQVIAELDDSPKMAGRIHSLKRHPNGKMQMNIKGEAGRTYVLEASTNLVNWKPICVVRPDEEGNCGYEDAVAGKHGSRFYRVVSSASSNP